MLFDFLKNSNEEINLEHYTRSNAKFEDGEWWYVQPGDGGRRRIKSHARKNTSRMFVNGKYIPKTHPLHKAGRYKSLDDAWSHNKIESIDQGEVYIIVNDAWKDWVKVGKAVSSSDRLNGYQTSSPFRDYKVVATLTTDNRHTKEKEMHKIFEHFAEERKGEWFKIDKVNAIKLFNYQVQENVDAA